MPNIQLARNLQTLRKSHHLTQEYLGKYLNITHQAYSNYEQCLRTPDIDMLIQIADLYHITLDQLVRGGISPDGVSEDSIPYNVTFAQQEDANHTLFLTKEEIDMILDYRALSSETKKMIRNFIKA
jgi:transcriptional regulator with XRE-family HTH domain